MQLCSVASVYILILLYVLIQWRGLPCLSGLCELGGKSVHVLRLCVHVHTCVGCQWVGVVWGVSEG